MIVVCTTMVSDPLNILRVKNKQIRLQVFGEVDF
jgi:hypothetical protein